MDRIVGSQQPTGSPVGIDRSSALASPFFCAPSAPDASELPPRFCGYGHLGRSHEIGTFVRWYEQHVPVLAVGSKANSFQLRVELAAYKASKRQSKDHKSVILSLPKSILAFLAQHRAGSLCTRHGSRFSGYQYRMIAGLTRVPNAFECPLWQQMALSQHARLLTQVTGPGGHERDLS
jgi:hypothetical protein